MVKYLGDNFFLFKTTFFKAFLTIISAVIILFFQPTASHAAGEMEIITVSENISTDTTWEGGKIYRISGWRTVNEGAVLTVQPGAVIKFVNDGVLFINGEILARGTEDNAIYFTVGDDISSPEVGQAVSGTARWSGISIGGSGKAVLEHAEIRHARDWGVRVENNNSYLEVAHSIFLNNKTGINVGEGTACIENSVFQSNEEGIKIFGLCGGEAFIKNNRFLLGAAEANKTGINVASLHQPVEILGNIFSGTALTGTVGVRIYASQDPENRLLNIMFNTFQDVGTAIKMEQGSHKLRGNNFSGSKLYGVLFDLRPQVIPENLKADIRYNFWNSSDGPRRLEDFSYVGSGDNIFHLDYLNFNPWGTRSYEPCYEPLEASIIRPQNGAYVLESAELQASAQDANLKELIFYIDGEEIFRVEENEITSGEVYGCEWRPAEGGPLKSSYLFTVKALNCLGEEQETSLTFNYLQETPSRPQVSIQTPLDGSYINGGISIEIQAAAAGELGEEGLDGLFLEIDGEKAAETGPSQTSLTWFWETAGYSEGFITLTARAVDILGQENNAEITVCLDRTPPCGTLEINGGGLYTSDSTVQLEISAADNFGIAGMKLSASPDFSQVAWMPFSASLPWVLGAGGEPAASDEHHVYLLLKDEAGNVSPAIQASIILDTISPAAVSLYHPPQGQSSVTLPLTFSWEPVESLSPPRYRLQLAARESGLSEEEIFLFPLLETVYLPDNSYTLQEFPLESGKRYLWRVKAVDLAGNQGPWSAAWEFRTRYSPPPAGEDESSPHLEEISNTGQEEMPGQETKTGPEYTDITKIFGDLEPGHPAAEAISFLYNRGIIKGVEEGTFAPEMPLNRAQAAALLMRLPLDFSRKSPTSPGTFKDLEAGAWYTSTVNTAAGIGLLGGYEDNTFRPSSPINGAEFAALICRLERFVYIKSGAPVNTGTTFKEPGRGKTVLEKAPSWAYNSVATLIERGIIGDEELLWFEPRQPLSRAEAAILLWKACLYYRIWVK